MWNMTPIIIFCHYLQKKCFHFIYVCMCMCFYIFNWMQVFNFIILRHPFWALYEILCMASVYTFYCNTKFCLHIIIILTSTHPPLWHLRASLTLDSPFLTVDSHSWHFRYLYSPTDGAHGDVVNCQSEMSNS